MSTTRPTLGFLGDLSGAVAGKVANDVELAPFSGTLAPGQQGLLVDGNTASDLDEKAVGQLLSSGNLLAISYPNAKHTASLMALTGQAPPPGIPLVTFKKVNGKRGYHCTYVPQGKMTTTVLPADSQPSQVTSSDVDIPLGAHLSSALLSTAAVGSILPPNLVPPSGTMAGYSSFSSPCQWNPGYPNINGSYDDNTAQQNTQPINNQFLTEFFVYWVNGGNIPYYNVILRQTGPLSIGSVLANSQNSRGWFQLYFQILPNTLTINGNPIASGVDLAGYSPQSGENNPQFPIAIEVDMSLIGQTEGGTGTVPYSASIDDTVDYSEWGINDQTSGTSTAWEAYQTTGWNPIQYPPADANTWWSSVYTNGNVVPMADQSFGSIDFEMLTCWRFNAPLFTAPDTSPFNPPPSLLVGFNGGWHHSPGFLHNHPGCHGAAGGEHFHIWGNDCVWNWDWTIDLGNIAAQQNIES